MTRRRTLLVWAPGLGALLSVGCLGSHNTIDPESAATNSVALVGERVSNPIVPANSPAVSGSPYSGAVGAPAPITADTVASVTKREDVAYSVPAPAAALPQPAPLPVPDAEGAVPPLPEQSAPEDPLITALRRVLMEHPQEAQKLLAGKGTSTSKRLLALLPLTAGVGEASPERISPEDLAEAADLIRTLRRRAPLRLGTVCFCRQITGFGRYEALPADHVFQAGIDHRPGECVRIYAEVCNFSCREHNGHYETVLASTLEIKRQDGKGRPITIEPGTCTDHSRTAREDYFLNFQFHIPATLTPGDYTLWVTIKDITPSADGEKTVREAAPRTLDFRVKAAGSAAEVAASR